ncbi:hypothetical protein [Actinoplanes siamensis]|uniref:Uncharacterized protein n=1 Tax=Actinoplanes siamensis TaxID=1223317 RepID=A0A919TNA4_9ACTN|nr:hypothetical protein [Actinoplanes siamensis]GIF09276.1 hypothetical protein Asi03nite_68140 [Actinoplanes siamensis]
MNLAHYLGLLHRAQMNLADAFRHVAAARQDEPDVKYLCEQQAKVCDGHADRLRPFAERYREQAEEEPDRLHSELFHGTRTGGLGLLRDLQDLYLMAVECDISWTVAGQAAQGARDGELLEVVTTCEGETAVQLQWLRTRMNQAAPQAFVVL